jgi:vacuolar-type H+-ATPase subunit E/Vma4
MVKSSEDSMQRLFRAVLSEAQAEADQVLAAARAKADAIRERAREQAQTERDEILRHARQEAESTRSQAIASAELQARTIRLERREKLLEGVFEAARQQLPTVVRWGDYGEIVSQLIREGVDHLGASAVRIRADAQTQALLTDALLRQVSQETGAELEVGETLEHGTGIVAETVDGHRQYDNTLEARLGRWQDTLRAPVYRILVGESL